MSNLRTRILALLLAVSMLVGYVLPAAAEEYQPGTEITGEVEPTPAPEEPATEPPTEAPTQAPTEPATEAPTQEVTEAPTAETDPVETEPEETDPEETNPEETEPEETEPEETEPEEEEKEAPYPEPVLYFAAPAEESLVYGMNVVNPGTSDICWDFPVSSATAVRCGGTLFATLRVPTFSPYRYLYFGSQAALEERMSQGGAFPVAEGVLNNGERVFHFTIGTADNSRITVCLIAPDATQESGYLLKEQELTIPSVPVADLALYADDTDETAVASGFHAVEYPAAPEEEQDVSGKLFVAEQGTNNICSIFKIEKATAVKDENNIYVTVYVTPPARTILTYDYLYFGDLTALREQLEAGGGLDVVGSESVELEGLGDRQVFHFTLPATAAGTRVPVCILKSDLTASAPYNSSELELVVPADIQEVEVKKDPVPTPVSYPAAPFSEQDVSGQLFVAKQGVDTVYTMFNVSTATAVKDDKNIYVTIQVNPAASGAFTYSYLYFGTRTDLIAQLDAGGEFDVVAGVNGSATQSYHFTLPLSAEGTCVPVCILKGDLTAKSPYNSSELELIVPEIPEGKITPVPTPVSYPAAPFDEEGVTGKLFVAKQGVDTVYTMFNVSTATAVKDDKNIYVTIQVNPAASGAFTYSYLYFGTKTELEAQLKVDGPFDVVGGVNGADTQSYHFTLPLSTEGTRVPVCILKGDLTAKSPYNSSELELVVPEIAEGKITPVPTPVTYPDAPGEEQDLTGKLFVAKADAPTTVYSMFKVSTATAVKDDKNIYVTIQVNPAASGAFTYSYLYFGTKTELEAQLKINGPFDVVGGVNGTATQSYHFTLPLNAEGTNVPVCILKSDLTAKSAYNSSELELVVPADIPEVEVKKDPVPTPVSYPAAPADEQDVSGKLFVAKQGADAIYPMFKIETATAIKDENLIYVTVQVNKAASGAFTYRYLYFGTRTALIEQLDAGGEFGVVAGVAGSDTQAYHFTLPLSAAGTRVPVCILKGDLTAKSAYNSSELELVVPADIPEVEVKKDPVPTPVSYPAAPAEERDITGLTVVEKETDTAYADFPIASAAGIKVDGQLYITALVSANSEGSFPYSYLYFGTKAQLEEQLSKGGAFGVVAAVVNGQTQHYHFTLSAEQADTRIPVCLLKADLTAENPYNAAELELVIPEIPEETAEAAPTIPALPDTLSEAGIKVIKVDDGAEFKMFAASKTGMVVAGDKLLIHFETTNTSYDALYFGSKEDGLKSPYVQGVQKDGVWVFEFELPASYRGAQNPICLRKTDGTWYSNKDLLISIPADSGDSATVNDDAGVQMYPVGQFSQTSFAVTASSAMLLGDRIYVTITGKMAENGKYSDKVAGMLYLGSRYDKDKTPYITGTVNADGTTTFTFTVPADKQGTSICAVVGFADGSWDPTNLDFFLNIPNFGRSFDLSYYTDGVYDLYGNAYAYLDKADRRSLPFDVGSTLTVSGNQITIKWVTRGNDTDKLYFGLQTDDKATREAQSVLAVDCTDNPDTPDYKVFYVTLPKSALGTRIPFVRHSRLWWTDTDGWLESQDYVIFSDYLPRTSDKPDDGTTIDDAGMKMLSGGSEVEQMFVITASSATLKGDTITCTITGKPAGRNSGTADKLYLGSRDDADKSNFIVGTLNDDETTTFVFDVPAEKQGTSIPVVVSFTGSGWDTTQDYFLNIPDFGTSFDLSYYTDGVYDLYGNSYAELSRTQNKAFPVDKGSTLSVAGNKIVIKWVTRTGSYDKLYFGSASDDEETRNAGAVEIEDYAGEATWKVYTVTLPKSALSARIPFARHSTKWYTATNGWLTTQDYLVLANRLPKLSDTPDVPVDPTDPTDPSEPSGEISDGTYNTTGETGASMFKVVKAVLDASGGKYKVTLTLSGTGYDYLCPGTGADAEANQSKWAPAKVVNCTINGETKDWYTYTFEVEDPTKPIPVASHSKKNNQWYDRTVTLDTANLKRTAKDGSYQVTTECDAAMFRIIDAKLKIVNGQIMADITLSGQGYDYLYPGTGAQADAETDKANWAPFRVNEDGKYVYTIPISALDEFIPIGSHSSAKNQWFDRSVKFLSNSLVAIGGTDPTDPTTPTTPTDPTDPTTPTTPTDPTTPTTPVTPTDPTDPSDPTEEPTVPSEPDLDGSTTVVDNSTGLKDGTYTPDGFSFSGGTGKTRIVCDKIIVKGGKSFAVIRFVSTTGSPSAYKYVKASGGVYYPTASGAFTIPVALNKNNRILGMTTKMTAAHEIKYILFVQLKNAKPSDPTDPTDPTDPDDGGTTSAVDNSTNLKDKDGYKPDSVTSSGGTNGTKVICDKVIVKGGKSYAVIKIVDASGNVVAHEYVKASGGKYDPASNGTFTIPVKLNAENRILAKPVGEDADEVEYKINIKVKGASSGGSSTQTEEEKEEDDPDSKLDKQAPEILGLEFKELIATPGARYLKLFQYDQGVVLAEVDLRRDTVLDTDEAIEELAQADKAAKEAQGETADVQSDEPTDNAQITADYIAELYQKDILKYLLVPEDVELPAGLEKQYLIVHVPASNVYLMDEDLGDTLKALDVLNSVTILGSDACEDDVIQELLESGEAVYGGTWEKPDYRTLIRAKMGMGLMSSDLLPLSEETLKERKEDIPQREALTAVEYRDRMTKLTERFAVLGVPMLVDRAADEPTAKGQAAWLKLYGLLYGKETQANKLYDAAIAKEEKA